MFKIFRFLPGVFCTFFVISSNANQCISYKINPNVNIYIPEYTKEVIQSEKNMDLLHGNVAATLVNNYDVVTDIMPVKDGYCVILKSIDATIGYSDFLIKVDSRHRFKTCSYNAIVSHENKHIDAYLSVIEDYKQDIYNSIYSAADSIMPIFVKQESDINETINELNDKLQSHPDIILILQKIHADEEIKNKQIDQHEDYSELKKCI